jgi:hypothetical protein
MKNYTTIAITLGVLAALFGVLWYTGKLSWS